MLQTINAISSMVTLGLVLRVTFQMGSYTEKISILKKQMEEAHDLIEMLRKRTHQLSNDILKSELRSLKNLPSNQQNN